MSLPGKPPGAAGVSNNYPWGPNPLDQYKAFIANAEFYGMPVGILRAVGKGYSFANTATAGPLHDQHANVWTNTMYLNTSTYDTLVRMELDLPFGEASAILTVYHESTHALLDLKEDEAVYKKFIADGIKHYQGAPLAGGGVSRTPDRLFNEAAASYVGGRVAGWWAAFETLVILLSRSKNENDEVKHRIKVMGLKTPRVYNEAMAERVFGYEEKSWHSSDQVETLRPVSDEMKKFMDHEILEDKVPDDFSGNEKFKELLADLNAL